MDLAKPEEIKKGLSVKLIGREVFYYSTLSSTMDEARQEIKKGAPEGTVIIAGRQTAARGRLGRSWISPEGNIALSVILYPDSEFLPYLIMIASVAVVQTIKDATELKASIKWPNDVLIGGRKVCGILIESGVSKQKRRYAIIGVGLNINLKSDDYPEVAETATSLESELGRNVSPAELLKKLITEMDKLYSLMTEGGAIFSRWRDEMKILGKRVRVACGGEVIEGIAADVLKDGSLILNCGNGEHRKILAGDVSLSEL